MRRMSDDELARKFVLAVELQLAAGTLEDARGDRVERWARLAFERRDQRQQTRLEAANRPVEQRTLLEWQEYWQAAEACPPEPDAYWPGPEPLWYAPPEEEG